MSKIIRNVKKKFSRMERGQVLVVVALAAVGIIAIIGLVIDVGLMFIGNARLRRAVDSAALSAALQYRKNSTTDSLTRSANEFLVLNGMTNPVSYVYDCDNSPGDPTLCTTPRRKLVRVYAKADVKLAFLPVIGINSITISAVAVSEAASLDVVLVIDRSESMTIGIDPKNPLPITDPRRDPFYCNAIPSASGNVSSCEPFNTVINDAVAFTQIMIPPFDKFSVVTFDKEPHVDLALLAGGSPGPVTTTLTKLTVFQGDESVSGGSAAAIYPNGSPSRCYGQVASCSPDLCPGPPTWSPTSNYQGLIGTGQDPCLPGYVNPPDPSHYTTTNIGGGLEQAGIQLGTDRQQNVLWVVILLTDGVANAGHNDAATVYFCPQDTWSLLPRCNHNDPNPADTYPNGRIKAPINGPYDLEYDASDYAYDMADFVGLPYIPSTGGGGQDALLYTIGLGPDVNLYAQMNLSNQPCQPGDLTQNGMPCYVDPFNTDTINYPTSTGEGLGRIFLNYAAGIGRGHAFYGNVSDLNNIFTLIGSNIATRLSQ